MAKMTKEQLRDAIDEAGLKLADLFTPNEILAEETVKKSKQEEYEHAKRVEKKLGEAREENAALQGKLSKLEGDNAILTEKANAGASKEILGLVATERKLDPKFVQYAEKNLKTFKSAKTGDELKDDIGKFVDAQAKEYVEMGKVYGFEAKVTTTAANNTDDKTKSGGAGAPPADGGAGAGDGAPEGGSDLEDPKKNDFIPA